MSDIEKKMIQNVISDACGVVALSDHDFIKDITQTVSFNALKDSVGRLGDYMLTHKYTLKDINASINQTLQSETRSLLERVLAAEAEVTRLRKVLPMVAGEHGVNLGYPDGINWMPASEVVKQILDQPTNTTGLLDLAVAAVRLCADECLSRDTMRHLQAHGVQQAADALLQDIKKIVLRGYRDAK